MPIHDDLGHQDIEHTNHLVFNRIFWVGIWKYIKEYCTKYRHCAMSNALIVNRLWGRYNLSVLWKSAIDFTTVDKSSSDIENILVLTDIFIRYAIEILTCNRNAGDGSEGSM